MDVLWQSRQHNVTPDNEMVTRYLVTCWQCKKSITKNLEPLTLQSLLLAHSERNRSETKSKVNFGQNQSSSKLGKTLGTISAVQMDFVRIAFQPPHPQATGPFGATFFAEN